MKKTLAVIIVVLMLVMQFTACSVNDKTSGSSGANTSAKTTEAEAKSNFNETGYPIVNKPVVYRAMNALAPNAPNWSSGEEGQSFWRAMKELTNIDFEFANIPSTDWETKLNLSLAANDIPHVYMGGVGDINIATYGVKGGVFVDLSKGIYELMPNLQKWFKKDPITEKCIYENNGAIYTFPSICLTATNAATSLYYREDFMNDAGITKEPQTIEEFYTMVKAIAEANADDPEFSAILPYSVDQFNNHFERFILAGLGDYTTAEFHDDGTGKVFYNGVTEQFYRYLEFAHKLYEEKILNNEFYTLDTATTTALTKANKAAVLTYGTMLLPENFKDGEFGLAMFTPLTSEYTSKKKINGRAGVSRSGITLTSECNEEDVKALLRWFDVIYSEEDVVPGLNSVSNWLGVRGETWDYVDDTHEKYKMIIPSDWKLSTTEFNYAKAGPSNLYAFEFMAIVDGASPGLKVKGEQSIKKLYPYEVSPFPLSYLSFTDEENDIYSTTYTDIQTYVKQMKAKFITGAEPLSNFEQYCATLEKMGLSKVIEVVQAAYDRFNE
jgi:putative aldouronate transport system substrate-binding protein